MGGVVPAPEKARKTLADLRAEKRDARPERSLTFCLAHDLVAEVQALTEELQTLDVRTIADEADPENGPPRKAGETTADVAARFEDPRATEIRSRLSALFDEMAEYEGELRVRANRTDGEWRRWVNEHPAREKGQPGYERDAEITAGYCNADDLIDDLAAYAHAWNGERLADGDWDLLGVSYPDKKAVARTVVSMYESGLDLPKLRSGLSASLARWHDADSPATSG